jgi:hypothetical protein
VAQALTNEIAINISKSRVMTEYSLVHCYNTPALV